MIFLKFCSNRNYRKEVRVKYWPSRIPNHSITAWIPPKSTFQYDQPEIWLRFKQKTNNSPQIKIQMLRLLYIGTVIAIHSITSWTPKPPPPTPLLPTFLCYSLLHDCMIYVTFKISGKTVLKYLLNAKAGIFINVIQCEI